MADDCRSRIGSRTRYFRFPTLDDLRAFCQPEDATLAGFEHTSGRGRGEAQVTTVTNSVGWHDISSTQGNVQEALQAGCR
jgi:hypothetical protein